MYKKNLLIITNSYPNQDSSYVEGIFVKDQVNYLKEYFNNIYVISPVAYGFEQLRKTTHQDYQYDNIKVFFPKYLNFPFLYYFGRPLWISLEANTVHALIKRENIAFDLIHAHMTWPSGAVAIELKRRFDVPVIITEHTSKTFTTAVKTKDSIWKNTLDAANAIIRIRKNDIALLESFTKTEVVAIPNGFDNKIFYPMPILKCRNFLGLPKEKKIILNVGNLYDPVKGHKYFIEAVSQIIKTRQDILGIIVGSGKLERELKTHIEKKDLGKYVFLAGSKPHSEIPLWLNACDVFVLPSLNEGNPTVMFEVLGCGKPFVGTKVGGVPEIITSEDYGILVNPADSHDLADKILMALDREWDTDKILKYAEQYTWYTIAKEIEGIYSKV